MSEHIENSITFTSNSNKDPDYHSLHSNFIFCFYRFLIKIITLHSAEESG
jgi:hypothetical protein